MLIVDADEYATQAIPQELPTFDAQKLQAAGCLRGFSMDELTMRLKRRMICGGDLRAQP